MSQTAVRCVRVRVRACAHHEPCRARVLLVAPNTTLSPPPSRTQVPALVMRSVENARTALDDGDHEKVCACIRACQMQSRTFFSPFFFLSSAGWLVWLVDSPGRRWRGSRLVPRDSRNLRPPAIQSRAHREDARNHTTRRRPRTVHHPSTATHCSLSFDLYYLVLPSRSPHEVPLTPSIPSPIRPRTDDGVGSSRL